jgi:two-component system response regulator HydG
MSLTVLVVDDEEDLRELCLEALSERGFEVRCAENGNRALEVLAGEQVDLVLTDLQMPGMSGIDLLRSVRSQYPDVDVVLMTAFATIPTAVEAMRLGAYDYIAKPFGIDDLAALLGRLAERRELAMENRLLREQLATRKGMGEMVGSSPSMQALYRLLLKFAPKRYPVLITGESGTGKELVARAIHRYSPWRDKPFVPVDCGALSSQLIESELFGHVRGAFTGATHDREGLLASAGQGTIFLDEIGELPVDLQAKLLRALQERDFRPIGGNRRLPFDARILAATNRNLPAEIRNGTFREDLYFRLNVLSVNVPPLRQRKDDIPLLVRYFLDRDGGPDEQVTGISCEAMAQLLHHDWPGNIRELENAIHRAIAVTGGPLIEIRDLPPPLRGNIPEPDPPALSQIDEIERQAILKMLEATGGHRLRAAKLLGIGKTTIYRKLKEYGLQSKAAAPGS